MRNIFTSVIVDGNLCNWGGRNPIDYPEDITLALEKCDDYQPFYHTAYPVFVYEVMSGDDLSVLKFNSSERLLLMEVAMIALKDVNFMNKIEDITDLDKEEFLSLKTKLKEVMGEVE